MRSINLSHLLFLLLLLLFSRNPLADDILVVVGKGSSVEKLTLKQLENIYRRKTLISEAGERWNPINLSANNPVRIAFAQKIFQQPPEVMEAYWNAQYFQGIMPPYVVNSVEAMLRFVEDTPGAIGYLLPCQVDDRVRVIFKLSVGEALENQCKKEVTLH